MPAAAPIPESRKKELEGFQRRKCPGHCLKRTLCVWLHNSLELPCADMEAMSIFLGEVA